MRSINHPFMEPYKIKSVELLQATTQTQRLKILKKAHYNPFAIPAQYVWLDLLTDSGTSAMSSRQWARLMDGDEAYAGSQSYYRLKKITQKLLGYRHIIPTHQGRAAERILFQVAIRHVGSEQAIIPNNTHFDTTRANIEFLGAKAVDLPCKESLHPSVSKPFKGNMDLMGLENLIRQMGAVRIPLIMVTITNNARGGQPVSMKNLRGVRDIAHRAHIPVFLDAARFAENAYFIQRRERSYREKSISEISREMFSLADGCTLSAKKDGLVNMGGLLGLNHRGWAMQARSLLILTEGFPTYGGLSGRDLDAMAEGFQEVVDEHYLEHRIQALTRLGEQLTQMGVPIIQPVGGHAIFIDAGKFLPHIPSSAFPGQALVCALFAEGGVRAVEIGSVMFGKQDSKTGKDISAPMELVRLAFPRRVYTQSHLDYLVSVIAKLVKTKHRIRGLRLIYEEPWMRHFTAQFQIRT